VAVAVTGAERRARLLATRIHLVLTETACRGPWREALAAALDSGAIGIVQVREKDLDDAAFVTRARAVAAIARAHGALVVVNDRVALVAACDADGAHVGEHDLPPREARAILGPDRILGVSAHDADEVRRAGEVGADYAGLGPCFPTSTKRLERAPGGASLVRAAMAVASVPVFAIGGITPENVTSLAEAGATRVAVGAGILGADGPAAAARAIDAVLSAASRRPTPGR
jgi:thiamine-phosphate pyrophosphorylase